MKELKPHVCGDHMSSTSQHSFDFKYSDLSTSIKVQKTVQIFSRVCFLDSCPINLLTALWCHPTEEKRVDSDATFHPYEYKLYGHGFDTVYYMCTLPK